MAEEDKRKEIEKRVQEFKKKEFTMQFVHPDENIRKKAEELVYEAINKTRHTTGYTPIEAIGANIKIGGEKPYLLYLAIAKALGMIDLKLDENGEIRIIADLNKVPRTPEYRIYDHPIIAHVSSDFLALRGLPRDNHDILLLWYLMKNPPPRHHARPEEVLPGYTRWLHSLSREEREEIIRKVAEAYVEIEQVIRMHLDIKAGKIPPPGKKPPAPALAKAVEEIEASAGPPVLAYKVRNMAYVLANLFQHPEDETKIHVEGIKAMYGMLGRMAVFLELFKVVLGVWERDTRMRREPTAINMILLGKLKNILLKHPGITGDSIKNVEGAGKLCDLLDERVINYLVDAYRVLGTEFSIAEIRELHGLLDTLHTMEISRVWSEIGAGAEFSEKALVLEHWRKYLAKLGIAPRAPRPEESRRIMERAVEAAVDNMEQRLGIMKGWEIAGKLREMYDKLFAEAEKVIESWRNTRSFRELSVLLNKLREIDMVHGSHVANQLFTAALDGALRKISEEARNIFLLSKYSKEAGESYAGAILSAAEILGFTRTALIPPLVAEIEEMRRELAAKKTVFENVRRRINALDSMVKIAYSRIKGLLEASVELAPYYPRELVKETVEQAYREMQGLVPMEKIHVKRSLHNI